MSQSRLLTAVANYFSAIKARVKPVISEKITLPSGATKTYNLATLGVDLAKFDPLSARIVATVLDTDTTSPTNGYFINSEMLITVGLKDDGSVIVQNYHSAPLTVFVRCDAPTKLKAA
jgi:hypothetical protein